MFNKNWWFLNFQKEFLNFSLWICKLAVAFYMINEIQPKIKFQNIVQCPFNKLVEFCHKHIQFKIGPPYYHTFCNFMNEYYLITLSSKIDVHCTIYIIFMLIILKTLPVCAFQKSALGTLKCPYDWFGKCT